MIKGILKSFVKFEVNENERNNARNSLKSIAGIVSCKLKSRTNSCHKTLGSL